MLKVRCSYDKPMSCTHRFNSAICGICEYTDYICEHNDASLYEINIFSVKKSSFRCEMDKINFLTDFVSLLSMKYGGIELVDYSFKEDISNKDYYAFKVVTITRE